MDFNMSMSERKDNSENYGSNNRVSSSFYSNFLLYIKILIKTFLSFTLSILVLYFSITGIFNIYNNLRKKSMLDKIPTPKLNREIPLFPDPVLNYKKTIQVWEWPPLEHINNYLYWLSGYDNCLFAAKMNAMKHAGMIPPDWEIKDFKRLFSPKELYEKWGLNGWDITLNDEILDEINKRINKESIYRYRWFSINSMDELVYLVKNGYHVMVGITVWKKPNKKYPYPRKNRDANISHSITITGISYYDPQKDLIKFETYDPLPKSEFYPIPVYNKYNENGYNIFGIQGVPYITKSGRARSGYIYKELNTEFKRDVRGTKK
ncbi:MAG TPA: hypothetical protein PKW55_02020 [Spirochaetota bacterium]|nr:hypothetical protein [Spirochaetota bacterium]HOM38370.1 hypothetical protein [Spirochaetota bacterium]HPQ48412.1 hypothetical protein [Spirochaetota bacterium]